MPISLTYDAGGMLVTGGTGRVGEGVVRRLADAGVPVVFTYRKDAAGAEALEKELRDAGHRVSAHHLDMDDTDTIEAALDRVGSEYGDLHGVACAGGPTFDFDRLMDFPVEVAERFVNGDALGVYRVLHAATRLLRARGGGTITVCTTIATKRTFPFDGLSPLSKGSVDALIHHVAAEEAENGIRCNGIAIGWVENRTIEQVREHTEFGVSNPVTKADRINVLVEQMVRLARLGRPVSPAEAGTLFAFLASEQAKYLTGQIIALDAGALL
jgi:NAD(P)-dependent dehydrogenase (short-subunit alcohol dehydrogenase family)